MNLSELLRNARVDTQAIDPHASHDNGRVQDLEMILDIVRGINSSLVLSELLERVVDQAIRVANADRGFLMLAAPGGNLEFVVGRNAEGEHIDAKDFQVSSSVLEDVFTTGESICIEHALSDDRFEQCQSIMNLELETILCSPLRTEVEIIGVIYVDSKRIQAVNKADILNVFEILAGHAAIAIKNARMYDNLKRAYEELGAANEHIIKLERMASKGEIAAEVGHELKNIIAIIKLSLEALQRRIERMNPGEARSLIDMALKGTDMMLSFSEGLLTRARASGKFIPMNLNTVVEGFVRFVKVLPKFKKRNITLQMEPDIPPVHLDVDQIHQVLLNLMNNAVEACADVSLELVTRYHRFSRSVELSVKDNGPGIDESVREKLLNERVTTKVDGHGFGLPICRQIIEHHGGSIRIESAVNSGATFVLAFPDREGTTDPKESDQ